MTREAKAGPYVMVFRDGDMAKLFHVGENGQRELVGWGDYFPVVVQFAGELIKSKSQIDTLEADRREHDLAVYDAIRETSRTADELAFWRYQAIFWRACAYDSRLMSTAPVPEEEETWRTAERDLEAARAQENRERTAPAEAPRDPGAT